MPILEPMDYPFPTRICRGCKKEKIIEDFHKRRAVYGKVVPISRCRECEAGRGLLSRMSETAKEQRRVAAKRYRQKHPEKVRCSFEEWKSRHPEYQKNRDANRRANPEEYAKILHSNKLNKRKRRSAGSLAAHEVIELLKRPCEYCNGVATEVDHIIPISRGGSNTIDNVVPCCRVCNARKNNRTKDEWLALQAKEKSNATTVNA